MVLFTLEADSWWGITLPFMFAGEKLGLQDNLVGTKGQVVGWVTKSQDFLLSKEGASGGGVDVGKGSIQMI